jgi:hypothetical protein
VAAAATISGQAAAAAAGSKFMLTVVGSLPAIAGACPSQAIAVLSVTRLLSGMAGEARRLATSLFNPSLFKPAPTSLEAR